MSKDEEYMKIALELAKKAGKVGEIPIGAVIIDEAGEIIGQGYNQKETHNDPTLHAELIAIREASRHLNSWRLSGCKMYVTLEPCPMCAGALVQARVSELILGTKDPKGGGICSKFEIGLNYQLNHQLELKTGVLSSKCSNILKDFFKKLRDSKL